MGCTPCNHCGLLYVLHCPLKRFKIFHVTSSNKYEARNIIFKLGFRPTSLLPAPPVPAHGIPLGGLATEREDTVDQPISLGRGGTRHLGAGAQLAHTPSWYEARGLDPDRHERRNSNGRWTSTGWQRQTDWEELHANPHATPSAPSAPSLPLGGIQSSERPYYPPPSSHQSMAQPNHNRSRVPIGNNWDMMRTADNRVRVITSLVK